jgi:hypothetical protein
MSVLACGLLERGQHDRAADPRMSADLQRVAGVVVEPCQDLHVLAGGAVDLGEPVVGEVGLPGLVGLLGLEPDVGALRSLRRVRGDLAVPDQDPVDRGPRHRLPVPVSQVPRQRVSARVVSLSQELFA